jgi:two-component system, OmpR family, sensor histidine kinase KdpD
MVSAVPEAAPSTEARAEEVIRRTEEEVTPALERVEGRRRQLIALLLIVFVLVAAGVVLFSLATGETEDPFGILDFNVLRLSFVALAIVFALYVWQKERDLRRAEVALVAARVRAAALRQRLRELSALTQAGKAVSAVLALEDLLQLIIESARDLLGATEGSVMLFDEAKEHLRVAASVGLDGDGKDALVPVGNGIAGWVAEHREPVIIQDGAHPDRVSHFASRSRHARTAMSAPLYRGDEPVGVLNVSVAEEDRRFGEQDLEALSVFAEHAAIAIANARAYEAEREAHERLSRMDARRREFVATLTHDLKAPLTSILGYTRLLRKGVGRFSDERAQGFIEIIDGQGRRILEMVERLVVATRLEEDGPILKRERLDLPTIVGDQVEGLRGMLADRRVTVRIADGLPPVYGDSSAIEHILLNLLDNAVKYSPEGAPIEVEVLAAEGEVLISVTDEGPGIADELLPQVFERYRQAGDGGSMTGVGLGLFIVHSLASAHGGRAWAENVPARGARITFTLPVRRNRAG